MIITKTAISQNNIRPFYLFESARIAFKSYLKNLNLGSNEKILLPAYIGWSSNEGSGIFDPIKELNLNYIFYELDENLNINLEAIQDLLENDVDIKVVLIVHYFGFVDTNIQQIANLINSKNLILIEDCAHSFFNDHLLGTCGRYGNAAFYSLHKLLPQLRGGGLAINLYNSHSSDFLEFSQNISNDLFKYDFFKIAEIRIKNIKIIEDYLQNEKNIKLFKKISNQTILQTYPILILNNKRDYLYFKLNELGFGVVSLYHTMIDEIQSSKFPISHYISNNILNLPIHQDINEIDLKLLLKNLVKELND